MPAHTPKNAAGEPSKGATFTTSSPLVLTPQHVYQEMKQLSAAEAVSQGGRLQETAPPQPPVFTRCYQVTSKEYLLPAPRQATGYRADSVLSVRP